MISQFIMQILLDIFVMGFPVTLFYFYYAAGSYMDSDEASMYLLLIGLVYIVFILFFMIGRFKCSKFLPTSFILIPLVFICIKFRETDIDFLNNMILLELLAIGVSLIILGLLVYLDIGKKKSIFIIYIISLIAINISIITLFQFRHKLMYLGFADRATEVSYRDKSEKRVEIKDMKELRNLILKNSGTLTSVENPDIIDFNENNYIIFSSNNRIVKVYHGMEKSDVTVKECYLDSFIICEENGVKIYFKRYN